MAIISTTMCYPSLTAPTQGVFIWRRLRAIHQLMPLKVVAPVPWFPFVAQMRFDPCCGVEDDPPIWRPRMFYLPGLLKPLDGGFYGRAFRRGLSWATTCHTRGGEHRVVKRISSSVSRQAHLVGRILLPFLRFTLHESRFTSPTKIDLVEAHFVWPDGVGAWRVARELGVPFVCTIRGKLVSQTADRSKRRQIREMLLGADGLIAVSRSLADLADEVAGRDLGARVIPNGVDGAVFRRLAPRGKRGPSAEARVASGWARDARYAVSVGHLQALKGFHRLVDIWPEVRRRAGDVRLVLVGGEAGEPSYVRRLRGQIERAGLGLAEDALRAWPGDNRRPTEASPRASSEARVVTVSGRVEPERVAEMLNAADLFVLASRSEGWCNAIAEALACGCPVVATDVGGNREIVNDPALGRLVPFGEREALVDAICGALERPWDRDRIAALGGGRDWQQVARECVAVFEAAMKRGSS